MSEPTGVFAEAAPYYIAGRRPYSSAVQGTLRQALAQDGTGLLLDVGSGPGALTLVLAPAFGSVVAVDPDPGMLAEGARRAAASGQPRIRWVQAAAEDLGPRGSGDAGRAGARCRLRPPRAGKTR